MYSKPVVVDEIKARHITFSLDLHFTNNITLLMGDSGMGKTVVFNILRELSATDSRLLCINYLDCNKNLEDELARASGRLVVIDNADSILSDEARKKIMQTLFYEYTTMKFVTH